MSIEDIRDTYTQYKSKSVPPEGIQGGTLFKEIRYTKYKSKLVPPEGIRFPANLGLVLTQLTTWDDWQAV